MWLERLVKDATARTSAGYYDERPDRELTPLGSLRAAVERAHPAVVAEIKRARPGHEPRELDAGQQAKRYAAGGACGVSVLTDPDHFAGSLTDLEAARSAGLPLLFKDFVVDGRQVDAAAAWGTSAVLVIARLETAGLTDAPLAGLVEAARDRGLEVLAEVTTAAELDLALSWDPDIVGINSRDLDTLAMDPGRTKALLADRDLTCPVMHLSGIEDAAGVRRALADGAQGVLVGSSLMAADDPVALLRSLTGVGA